RKAGEFRIVISKYSGTTGLMFNKTLFPQAEDRRIRLAVAHAMNREQYASKILGGICEPATSILTPATFGFLPGLPQIAYDPAKAKALRTEAGIKPGMKVTFTLHTEAFSALPSAPLLLEAIAGDLQAVGFEVERQPVDSSAWISMMRAQKQPMIYYSPSG